MVTRFRVGTNRPTQRFNLHVSTISHIPKSYPIAFRDPNWYRAMLDEYTALIKNNTWILVPRPSDANKQARYTEKAVFILRLPWESAMFRADVANGSTQLADIDVDETFSLVVKPATIRTVLSLAISRHWPATQAWFQRFATYAARVGFLHSRCDSSLFIYRQGIITSLHAEFSMTNLGSLNYFLGIFVTRNASGMFLSQQNMRLRFLIGLRQFTLSRSSAEAEYRGVANAVAETCWLRNLLRELHKPLATATLVYCDNVSVVYLSSNPMQHQHMKHIEIDIHFVRDLVATGAIRVLHVPSRYQYANIFTKGLLCGSVSQCNL
ncbi:ribonuclease H-like domain-containing protein [Tanacetum coccineum]